MIKVMQNYYFCLFLRRVSLLTFCFIFIAFPFQLDTVEFQIINSELGRHFGYLGTLLTKIKSCYTLKYCIYFPFDMIESA